MRYCVMHLHDEVCHDPGEEVAIIVPGGERTAILVPLDALADFLPILHEAAAELPAATCGCCGAALPAPPSKRAR